MLSVTAGGTHAWYEAEHRGKIFKVRKQLGTVDLALEPAPDPVIHQPSSYVPRKAKRSVGQRAADYLFGRK